MIRKTFSEKRDLRVAKRDYKLSKQTDIHEAGRQEMLKAIFDGIKHVEKNWGSLKIGELK